MALSGGQISDIQTQLVASGFPAEACNSILMAIDAAGFDLTERSTSSTTKSVTQVTPDFVAIEGRPGLYVGTVTVAGSTVGWLELRLEDGSISFVPPIKM